MAQLKSKQLTYPLSGSFTGSLFGTASYADYSTSSSYALTASYVANASSFPFTGSAIITGSLEVIGPVIATSFTGSLFGTASYAETASFAPDYLLISETGSMLSPYVLSSQTGSMTVLSASYASSSLSASYSISSSHSNFSISSSYAATASLAPDYLPLAGGTITGNLTVDETIYTGFIDGTDASGIILQVSNTNISIADEEIDIKVDDTSNIKITPTLISTAIPISASFTGSLFGTASYYQESDPIFVAISASLATTGSNIFIGNQTITGSLNISGSETIKGYVQLMPVTTNIDNSISASYVYVSGSTNDLYFTQNGSGYANTTRLRWLEGNLYTGLLHGGLITTQSSTVFQVSSGSGIIVNLNASQNDNPYPTIRYVNWNNLSASITLTGSYDQSFVSIDSNGQIHVQGTPYINGEYNTLIPIGNVIHQNRSTINATATYPSVAYGWKQRSSDFIRAFGPLKLSGLDVAVSGSSTGSLIITSGTSFNDGRNYVIEPNNPSYVQDTGTTISKIFRYYQSGSNAWVYLTNGGAGYATIDPTKYSNNGTLTPVPGTGANKEWTIQRVYWFTGGATKGIYVYYGNVTYTSKDQAIANIHIESFTEAPNTAAGAVLSGYLIVRNDANFTNPASYQIIPSGLFRSVGGSGGGGSVVTQTLFGLSDVSIISPTNGQPLVYNSTTIKWENSSALSASLHGNADTATSASYALTASYIQTAQTASYVLQAISSSFASTASFAPDYVLTSVTGSMLQPYVLTSVTSSMNVLSAQTASYVQTAQTASYVLNAVSSSIASTASYVTASNVYGPYGLNSILSSSYALTASYALTSAGGGSGAGFPFTGSAVITGSLIVTGSATFTDSIIIDATLVTSSIVTTGAGTTVISTQATGSYRSMFAKYVVSSGANSRAGEFMSVWNGANIRFTDTSTTDIGTTAAVVLTGSLSGANVQVSTAPGTGWTVKLQTTYL